MSIPNQETVFGIIEFQNNTYELLSQPLEDEQFKKIKQYKKDNNCGSSSAPWSVNKYSWKIENDKLFLVDVQFKLCTETKNHIENIFDTDKLFASWVNREIKLLVSKNDIDEEKANREVIILTIENGIVQKVFNKTEKYPIPRIRKYMV